MGLLERALVPKLHNLNVSLNPRPYTKSATYTPHNIALYELQATKPLATLIWTVARPAQYFPYSDNALKGTLEAGMALYTPYTPKP